MMYVCCKRSSVLFFLFSVLILSTGCTDIAPVFEDLENLKAQTVSVEPVYAGHANWNKYLNRDSTDHADLDATGAPCDTETNGGFYSCIHGGEKRKVVIDELNSCHEHWASDSLDAFDWNCYEKQGGGVVFYTQQLRYDKGLGDLIDSNGWKNIEVSIQYRNQTAYKSDPANWWQNPVLPVDHVSGANLNQAGTVYYIDSTNNSGQSINITASEVGLVVLPGYTYSAASGFNPIWAYGSPTPYSHLWIEGIYDGGTGLQIGQVGYSQFRRMSLQNSSVSGATFLTVSNSAFKMIDIFQSTGDGMFFSTSNNNHLEYIKVTNSGAYGILTSGSSGNFFSNTVSEENFNTNIKLDLASNNNSFHRAMALNSLTGSGFTIYRSEEVTLHRVVASNNFYSGIEFLNDVDGSAENRVIRALVTANGQAGLDLSKAGKPKVVALTSANNGGQGASVDFGYQGQYHNLVFSNNGGEEFLFGSSAYGGQISHLVINSMGGAGLKFVGGVAALNGLLLVDSIAGGLGCGIHDNSSGFIGGTCTDTGVAGSFEYDDGLGNNTQSDAVLAKISFDLSDTFVGDLGIFSSWTGFLTENPFQVLGLSSFIPGHCSDTANCHVWDWSLLASDQHLLNRTGDGVNANGAFPSVSTDPCPSEVDGSESIYNSGDGTYFLANAIELMYDGYWDGGTYSNDYDGLCETNEVCLYTPNFGAYQGHGEVQTWDQNGPQEHTCQFTDGANVTGVKMYAHPN